MWLADTWTFRSLGGCFITWEFVLIQIITHEETFLYQFVWFQLSVLPSERGRLLMPAGFPAGRKGLERVRLSGCCDVSRDCNASEFGTRTLQAVKWQAAGLTGFYYRRTQTFSARHQLWVRPSLLSSDRYSGKDRNVKLTAGLNLMHWLRMLSFTSIFVYIFGVAIKYRENFVFHLSRG